MVSGGCDPSEEGTGARARLQPVAGRMGACGGRWQEGVRLLGLVNCSGSHTEGVFLGFKRTDSLWVTVPQ